VDVLLVTDGLAAEAPAIVDLTRKKHVLSAANSAADLERGISLCVTEQDGKQKIFVHLGAAQQEGIRFSSNLLKLVTLVR
jgi:hypothetical protein